MTLAEAQGAEIYFHHKCEAIDWNNDKIEFENTAGKQLPSSKADIIFGADGAFSAQDCNTNCSTIISTIRQYYIDYGYKELSYSTR